MAQSILSVRVEEIPFEISSGYDPFHSKANTTRLLKAVVDAEQGKNMVAKIFNELEAMEND